MFSSNQELILTGPNTDKAVLKNALVLLLDGYNFKPSSYNYKNGMFCFYEKPPKYEASITIEPEDLNVEYLNNLVNLYLSSSQYKKMLDITYNEYGCCDGSTSLGWEMSINKDSFFNIVTFKPFYCFYSK